MRWMTCQAMSLRLCTEAEQQHLAELTRLESAGMEAAAAAADAEQDLFRRAEAAEAAVEAAEAKVASAERGAADDLRRYSTDLAAAEAARATAEEVGAASYCSPRHTMPFKPRDADSICVGW